MRARMPAAVLAIALLVPLPALAEDEDEIRTTKGHSQPIYSQSVTEEYRVPTDHGTIYGVVRRPVVPEGVKVPVILTYSPYNILGSPTNFSTPNDSLANYYVPRGYARAWFDLVGTRESSGCYDFGGIAERESGAAVVDFLGTREWSNGRVGMIGGSYDGTTQYAAAIEAPEHLATIVPQVAIDRWWDYPYHGGIRRWSGFGTPLLFDFGFGFVPPTDPRDPLHYADAVSTRVHPCRRVEHQVRGFGYDPAYDAFWEERDYRAQAANVTASVLIEGGWQDFNVRSVGSTQFFQALPDDHPKKMVMGQWGHTTPGGPRFTDWTDVRHAWFDYWLLGYDGTGDLPDTGVMDLPRMDTETSEHRRIQHADWPPAETRLAGLPFVAEATEEHQLALEGPTSSWETTRVLTKTQAAGGNCEGACIRYLGEPLTEPLRLSGGPEVDVVLRTDALHAPLPEVDTWVTVTLFTVNPSGQRQPISWGLLNSRNRRGLDQSEPLPNGATWRGTVELVELDHVVPAGHRLGVALASSMREETFAPPNNWPVGNTLLAGDDDGPPLLRLPVTAGHRAVGLTPPDEED